MPPRVLMVYVYVFLAYPQKLVCEMWAHSTRVQALWPTWFLFWDHSLS